MQHSPNDIKEKLLRALDKDNNVVDMVSVIEAIAVLERIPITKDELEKTRLGKYINELRRKTKNDALAKRAKELVRKWRMMILPTDTATQLNGERSTPASVVSPASHPPGPGPGSFIGIGGGIGGGGGGRKSTSPAVAANHVRAGSRAAHHHALSSPGYSQCSSTSTSPSLFAATAAGRLRAEQSGASGAVTSPYAARLAAGGRLVSTFKPVSPAPTTTTTITPTGAVASGGRYSSACKNVSSPAARRSPVSAVVATTPRSNRKRPREDDADNCDSFRRHGSALSSAANSSSSSSPRVANVTASGAAATASAHHHIRGMANGVAALPPDTNSMDSTRSADSDGGKERGLVAAALLLPHDEEHDALATTTKPTKRKNSRRARVEKCDMLKDKLASHLRTPKVKTTAELIQELKARNSGSGSASAPVRTSAADRAEAAAAYSVSRKAAYSALLGTDDDVTRSKTELMEKFLKDSVVGPDGAATSGGAAQGSSRNHKVKSSHAIGSSARAADESLNGVVVAAGTSASYSQANQSIDECVAAILSALPPVCREEVRWASSSRSGSSESGDDNDEDEEAGGCAAVREEVTDEQLLRLHDGRWEGVNGNTDREGEFRRWNESVTLPSFDSDVLHILPYVSIDERRPFVDLDG